MGNKRSKGFVNYMNVPVKKNKKKKKDAPMPIHAFTVLTTSKGHVTTEPIKNPSNDANEPIVDVPKEQEVQLKHVPDIYEEEIDVPRRRKLYKSKSNGHGTLHVKIVSWKPHRQEFLDELLSLEACPPEALLGECPMCLDKNVDVMYRCLDCFMSPVHCKDCTLKKHEALPFHRIQKWDGEFFDRCSLRELGLRIQLGHCGLPCSRPEGSISTCHILDTNGFHYVAFNFCDCSSKAPRHVQLLRAKLFPASIDWPQTAYTFDVLDTFLEMTLQGKTNVYDFFVALLFRTNKGSMPSLHKYKDFALAVRLWRHLLSLKCSGRGHDPLGVENTKSGELAVECPACPHPDRNLPPDWQGTPEEAKWLYTLFLAIDANFKLKLKDRGFRDVELAPGWAYFVEESAYQQVINSLTDEVETNTCRSQHNAILAANIRNNREYKASGTGAVVCGRHSLVMKCGVGDLQKGERYSNMDYIILSALENCRLRDLVVSYDIACQWSKNFKTRLSRYLGQLQLDFSGINLCVVVPKFHLPAHGPQCQTRYSLNFLPRVGRTYGEGVESEWAHINGTALSTREMAPGARHEALNDHWGAWNWKKILGFCDYFLKKLEEAVDWKAIHQKKFASASATISAAKVLEWTAMIEAWNLDQSADDPYAEPSCETSLNDVRKQFADEDTEAARKQAMGIFPISLRSFISIGLELEERQRVFHLNENMRNGRTSLLDANIKNMCTNLFRHIAHWRQAQYVYMPRVSLEGQFEDNTGPERVEHLRLCLPSDKPSLASAEGRALEGRLRIAQIDDALATIRRLQRAITALTSFKKKNVDGMGNRQNTRVQSTYAKFQSRINLVKQRYRKAREALIALEPDAGWKTRLRELLDSDIRGPGRDDDDEDPKNRNKDKSQQRLGEGYHVPSWIWLTPGANMLSDGADLVEFGDSVRVEWAKSKARVERWDEEIKLLCEEMRRVLYFLKWKSDWWKRQRGARPETRGNILSGLDAYASKQSAIFARLASSFFSKWSPRLLKLQNPPSWLSEVTTLLNETGAKRDEKDSAEQPAAPVLEEEDENGSDDESEVDEEDNEESAAGEADMFNEDDLLVFENETFDDSGE